jgi:hypothetical protein
MLLVTSPSIIETAIRARGCFFGSAPSRNPMVAGAVAALATLIVRNATSAPVPIPFPWPVRTCCAPLESAQPYDTRLTLMVRRYGL